MKPHLVEIRKGISRSWNFESHPSSTLKGAITDSLRGENYCGSPIGACSRICVKSRSFSRQ